MSHYISSEYECYFYMGLMDKGTIQWQRFSEKTVLILQIPLPSENEQNQLKLILQRKNGLLMTTCTIPVPIDCQTWILARLGNQLLITYDSPPNISKLILCFESDEIIEDVLYRIRSCSRDAKLSKSQSTSTFAYPQPLSKSHIPNHYLSPSHTMSDSTTYSKQGIYDESLPIPLIQIDKENSESFQGIQQQQQQQQQLESSRGLIMDPTIVDWESMQLPTIDEYELPHLVHRNEESIDESSVTSMYWIPSDDQEGEVEGGNSSNIKEREILDNSIQESDDNCIQQFKPSETKAAPFSILNRNNNMIVGNSMYIQSDVSIQNSGLLKPLLQSKNQSNVSMDVTFGDSMLVSDRVEVMSDKGQYERTFVGNQSSPNSTSTVRTTTNMNCQENSIINNELIQTREKELETSLCTSPSLPNGVRDFKLTNENSKSQMDIHPISQSEKTIPSTENSMFDMLGTSQSALDWTIPQHLHSSGLLNYSTLTTTTANAPSTSSPMVGDPTECQPSETPSPLESHLVTPNLFMSELEESPYNQRLSLVGSIWEALSSDEQLLFAQEE